MTKAARMLCAALFALSAMAGCTRFPELDAAVPAHLENADYPELVPIDPARLTPIDTSERAAELEGELTARSQRLRARARALQTPIIDAETEARMRAGVGHSDTGN